MAQGARNGSGEDVRTGRDILECLEKEGPLSRAAIAKRLNLSRTTLTNLITRFIDLHLVTELGDIDPQGRGRPGIPVTLDTSTWYALGAEFHSGRWVFAVANLKGEVILTRTFPVSSGAAGRVVAALLKGIRAVSAKAPGRLLPAVGIGVPGLVNWDEGRIIRADDLGWEDVRIREAVEGATDFSALVMNRNRATGLAEARYGLGRGVGSFIYIGIGTGISAAIMLGGTLLNGTGYGAGEVGHITVDPDGPLCRCGKRGCLQVLAAGGAVAGFAREMLAGRKGRAAASTITLVGDAAVDGEAVCAAAMAGDGVGVACLRRASTYLGMTVGNLVTTFNPDKILVGGPLVRVAPVFVDYIREEASRWAMRHPFSQVVIEASTLDDYAGALGAAGLVLSRKLELSSQ